MKKKAIIILILILSALIVETPPMAKADGSVDAQDIWMECDDDAYPEGFSSTDDGGTSFEDAIRGSIIVHSDLMGLESTWDFNVTRLNFYIDVNEATHLSTAAVYQFIASDNAGALYGESTEKSLSGTGWKYFYPEDPIEIPSGTPPKYWAVINANELTGLIQLRWDYNIGPGEGLSKGQTYGTYPDPMTGESVTTSYDYWIRGYVTAYATNQTVFNHYYGTPINGTTTRRDLDLTFPSGVSNREIKMTFPKNENFLNITYYSGGEWNESLSVSDYTLDMDYNSTHMLFTIPESTIANYGEDYRIYSESYTYGYDFYGLFYENGTFAGGVDITAVTDIGPVEYYIDGYGHFATDNEILFFFWDLPGGGTRRVYVTAPIETFYLFTPHDTYSSYSFDITDYIGAIGFQDSYLEMYAVVNTTSFLVERYLIWDSESTSPLTAMLNKIYDLKIKLPNNNVYSFGYWVPTTATPPTLTLSLLDPDDYYQPISGIVEIEATRPNATHIQIEYLDKMDLTLSVFVNITLRDETIVYNFTGGSPIEIFNWYDAVNTTEYVVNVRVSHSYYGEVTYSTILIGETDYDSPPSWSIIGIEDQWVYLGLIVVVAGTVSRVNAAAGLFAGACVASAFVYRNLVEIPYELLAGAFIISILMELTKR